MNQNHDTPRIALRTASCLRVSFQIATDSGIGFQRMTRSGAPACARGIARLTRLPAIASSTTTVAAVTGPYLPATAKISPPKIIPARIEIDVPISTSPLPPVSSRGCSTDGRIEYFTGPNSVDCSPVPNNATSNTVMFWVRKPIAASDMITISIVVVMRISLDFSSFSAICPAVAENRKYGAMNSAGARLVYSVRCSGLTPSQNSRPMIACR